MGLNSQKRGICQQTWDLFFPWEDDFATNYGFFFPIDGKNQKCDVKISGGLLIGFLMLVITLWL